VLVERATQETRELQAILEI